MSNYLLGLLQGCWLGFMLGTVVEAMRNHNKRNECLIVDKVMKPEDYKAA